MAFNAAEISAEVSRLVFRFSSFMEEEEIELAISSEIANWLAVTLLSREERSS